jgi:glycosyltransferase 2 family protein
MLASSIYTRLTRLLRWTVSVALLLVMFRSIDVETIKPTLAGTQPLPLSLAFVMLLADRYLFAVRWKLILQPYVENVRISTLTRITFVSTFLSNFLPSALSSDVVRTYFLHKERTSMASVISSVLLDRLVGFVSLLLLSMAALGVAYVQGFLEQEWLMIALVMTGTTAVAALLVTSSWLGAITVRMRKSSWRIWRQIGKTVIAVREYPWTAKRVVKILGLACGAYVSAIIATYLVFYAMGGEAPIGYFFIFTLIVQLAMSIPISIGSLGVHEGAWVVVLGTVGVAPGEAFLFALLLRTVNLLVSLPGGVLYAIYSPQLAATQVQLPGAAHAVSTEQTKAS